MNVGDVYGDRFVLAIGEAKRADKRANKRIAVMLCLCGRISEVVLIKGLPRNNKCRQCAGAHVAKIRFPNSGRDGFIDKAVKERR